jgi:hypothetical protein
LTICIEIYLLFNKISRFLKIEKSIKIFLDISPSTFGSLEKIVVARVFKGQSAFFSFRFYEVYYVANEKKIHCAYALNFESKEAIISFDPTLKKISIEEKMISVREHSH